MAEAPNALLYGHSWYLDAVTALPGWTWEGLVVDNVPGSLSGTCYEAVLPIPLRKRWGQWVVYQPLFCQFLAIFSKDPVDPAPLIQLVNERYRHVSKWHLLIDTPMASLPNQVRQQVLYTHTLSLRPAADAYTQDRRMNLRRAFRRLDNVPDWQVVESADVEPLLGIFRENHAAEIGVGKWAYDLFRAVFANLQARGLGTLQYVQVGGQIVAGAYFATLHNRVIYLFNAANSEGRRLNARSVLIDRLIREEKKKATNSTSSAELLLDFESPEKSGVVSFYESFGASPQPYLVFSWSRSNWLERAGQVVLRQVRSLISGRPVAVSNQKRI